MLFVRGNAAGADEARNLTANSVIQPDAVTTNTTLVPDAIHPGSIGYAWLAGSASGTYANANTYHGALRTVLRWSELGAGYVP